MVMHSSDVSALARPLTDPGDLTLLLDRIGDARVVQIGEASHGTHEFYAWRSALTQRLIEERGFSFVAVEGDWPDCARVDRAVRGGDPLSALLAYDRWPTWMWANEEVLDFTQWLRVHNDGTSTPVGFHGLDVYSLWQSMREVLSWLREHDPGQVSGALQAYQCFEPYAEDPHAYAWGTRFVNASCESAVVRMLTELYGRDLAVWQNAEVVAGAEHYYRALVSGRNSWNVRDRHMDDTLARLLDHYGPGAKAVVWAHNTHVGDSRATDQVQRGDVTIGQLARERYGASNVVLIGMASHRGTVIAGSDWGAPMRTMRVPEGRDGSIEDILHAEAPEQAMFVFPPLEQRPGLLVDELPHRAIGVVYRPERDAWANYVPSVLGERYDAFLWFDETQALRPLHPVHIDTRELETYPSGV
ncbi:MAG: erythromycin esterase family protein [Actinoplanes sp.]